MVPGFVEEAIVISYILAVRWRFIWGFNGDVLWFKTLVDMFYFQRNQTLRLRL